MAQQTEDQKVILRTINQVISFVENNIRNIDHPQVLKYIEDQIKLLNGTLPLRKRLTLLILLKDLVLFIQQNRDNSEELNSEFTDDKEENK